jgi:outer membrane protein assembly factor BamD
MKGLAKFSKEKELLSSVPILGELTYKRDLTKAKESFDELTEFISRFPESSYVEDAKRRMLFLRSLIAEQEIEVAEFYIERKAYIAAVSRADYIISNLPNSEVVQKALEIKVQAYDLMGKEELKNQAAEILKRFIETSEKKAAANS